MITVNHSLKVRLRMNKKFVEIFFLYPETDLLFIEKQPNGSKKTHPNILFEILKIIIHDEYFTYGCTSNITIITRFLLQRMKETAQYTRGLFTTESLIELNTNQHN